MQVVDAVVEALQGLEEDEVAQVDGDGAAALQDTLSRMTSLYVQHHQLQLAINTSRKCCIGL